DRLAAGMLTEAMPRAHSHASGQKLMLDSRTRHARPFGYDPYTPTTSARSPSRNVPGGTIMSTDHHHAAAHFERLLRFETPEEVANRLMRRSDPLPPSIPGGSRISEEAIERRWQLMASAPESRAILLDSQTDQHKDCYRHNIENFIGTVKVPV